ncbi:MAG: FAD-binding protein [Deltaproteobacteria bacterium]|nr:FAD-binding protein [Deltaproteobacteria bacterium]
MKGMARDLRKIVPGNCVLSEPEDLLAYASDATADLCKRPPDAVVIPANAADVAKVMRYAFSNGVPVTPRGAGSGLAGGATPVMGGIVLDMKRMNKVIEVNRRNMTATVEAGVVLNSFKELIARESLFYPPDPQSAAVCTIGGNVATRAGGPRGVKYGTTSNYVLGLTAVLPDGEIIKAGGTCVKQSVGYDITHLFTGSEGTLGVITDVNLRLLPLPPASATAMVVCATTEQAAQIVSDIIAAGTVPAMLEFLTLMAAATMNQTLAQPLPLTGQAYLLMEIDGTEAGVKANCEVLTDLCTKSGAQEVRIVSDPAEAAGYWKARASLYPLILTMVTKTIIEDVTVPRDRLPEFVKRIQDLSARLGVMIGIAGHAGDGNMHPSILFGEVNEKTLAQAEEAVEEIVRTGLDLCGTISGEHGIGLHKARFLEWEMGKTQVALMKRIKAAFDPKSIMNPGKIWLWGKTEND